MKNYRRLIIMALILILVLGVFAYRFHSSKISTLEQDMNDLQAKLILESEKNEGYSQESYNEVDFQFVSTAKISEDFDDRFYFPQYLPKTIESSFVESGKLRGVGLVGQDDTYLYYYAGLGKKQTQHYECEVDSIKYNDDLNILQVTVTEKPVDNDLGNRDIETFISTLVRVEKNELPEERDEMQLSINYRQ